MKRFDFDKMMYEAKRRGYKQKDLAAMLGMDATNFSEKKRKNRELTMTQGYYIASQIGTTMEMFMVEEGE